MFGLLNLNKPPGVTSRDVVNRVQRLRRGVKIGHAGTLDPLATGVLVLGLGPATRLVESIQQQPKRYLATFLLGRTSDTEDIEGQVVELAEAPQPARSQIEAALPRFIGCIQQLPPAYSALKVDGRRAYALARAGHAVELQPRSITIHELRLVRYEYPQLELDVACSSGTYIRSLGRDLAQSLGTGAVMSALTRTAVGVFRLEDAHAPESLTAENLPQLLLPASWAVAHLPQVTLAPEELRRLGHGLAVSNRWAVAAEEIAAQDGRGALVAILQADGPRLKPLRNFPQPPLRDDAG